MEDKQLKSTEKFLSEAESQGINTFIRNRYSDVISLGAESKSNVYRIIRHYLLSVFSMEYFSKLNILFKEKYLAQDENSKYYINEWIDRDVMDVIDGICETDIFDDPKSMAALSDIVISLHNSINNIDDDSIESDIDYITDMPYQFNELINSSPNTPRIFTSSFRQHEESKATRMKIHYSNTESSITYTVNIRQKHRES